MTDLLARLPSLPGPGDAPLEPHPGSEAAGLFVRRTTDPAPEATRAVYLHGMGGSSTNWTDLMYLLAPAMPGIAPDLPGYGFSAPSPDGRYSLARNARAVVELVESEECGPVHLFGNSMGGATATIVAATRPDLVKTLTLISPALLTRTAMGGRHIPLAWNALLSLREGRQLPPREAAAVQFDRAMRLCYANAERVPAARRTEALSEIQRRLELPYSVAVNLGTLRSIVKSSATSGPESIWNTARSVSTPTFGIYGARDRLVPVSMASRAAEAFERGRMVILEDCGHVAQMEHPQLTAQIFLQWIASVTIDN
ncbi:MAG: alpha/beta hydrolase [Candidatus Nanopelagicales bacterium]|nr:alpha/beta hydrolase [Candidatus Nanopelagicales bacterium]